MSASRRGSLSLAQVQADDELLDRLGSRSVSVPERNDALIAAFVALTDQIEAPHLHAVPSPAPSADEAPAGSERRWVLPRTRRRLVAVPALRSRTARRVLRPATGAAVAMSMVLFGSGVAAAIGDEPFDPVGQVAAAVRGVIGPAPSVPVVAEDLRRDLEQALRQLQREQPEAAREIVEGVRRDAVLLPADQERDVLAEVAEVSAQLPPEPMADLDSRRAGDRAQRGARGDLPVAQGADPLALVAGPPLAWPDQGAQDGRRIVADGAWRWTGSDRVHRYRGDRPTAPATPGVQDDKGRPGADRRATDQPTGDRDVLPTAPAATAAPTRPPVLVPTVGALAGPLHGGIARPPFAPTGPTSGPPSADRPSAGPPSAGRPSAGRPATPAPMGSEPVRPGPVTSAPVTPGPVASAPVGSVPASPGPTTPVEPPSDSESRTGGPQETAGEPADRQVAADPDGPSGSAAPSPDPAAGADDTTP